MSTKIYYGVRFPKARLAEFVSLVRVKGLEGVYKRALKLVKSVSANDEELVALKAAHPDMSDWDLKADLVLDRIKQNVDSPEPMPWLSLDCGWKLWVPCRGRYILASPYGEQFIKLPEWVEEYGYWNNTDRPDSVSPREWSSRKRAWQIACGPSYEDHHMLIEVFRIERRTIMRGVSFFWLEIRLRRKGRWGKPTGALAGIV